MNEELHLLPDARRTGRQPVRTQAQPGADEAPLRAEVFSAAQMAVHGRQLAARHELAHEDTPDRLLVRLAANGAVIQQACAALARAARNKQTLAPAAETLLDDYHLVAEHVRSARHQLPPACSRALPRLAGGAPRIYQLALEVVTHGDGRLEQESLARFVAAYQEGAPLKLVELRTIPVMLRLALVDNLRRIAARLDARRVEHELAEGWAERLIATSANRPGDLVLLVADMARAVQPLGAGFVADLAQRLQGGGAALAQVLEWIGARLADEGSSIAAHVQLDSASQAADAESIANSLASLRLVAAIDWHDFVETMSAVEATLRQDPAGVHARMDAATRAHYRHAVERLAQQSRHGESEVAAEALALANAQPVAEGADGRMRHVGYYLAGAGLPALRARLRMRAGVLAGLRGAARRRPLLSWLGAVGGFTLLFVTALLVHAWIDGAGMPLLLALALLSAFGASQLALALVNAMTARLVRPQPLARMDFGAGIPHDAQTLVVVPALLDSAETVAALGASLEVCYLANRDPQLRFCLLGDFADAPQETMFEDAELLEGARSAIAALNARHGDGQGAPFLLLQRPRTWSGTEGAWIGRERKRGKLADLNAFLRGGARERFVLAEGGLEGLDQVRYVIALDPDTQLPRDAARQLVAAMAHPLNRPLLDPSGSRVIAGHGLLQPRVTTSLPVDDASRYERLCGGEPGIDLYAHTAPDVYQDLFGQGAWLGKGIYEVDTFERVLGARLPDGQVLAHEPLEDVYLRSGLASDVQVYQAYPARYSDDVGRRHRRIRGAWQLAGWLRARVPAPGGGREANPLPPLARWKLFDALRRSLVAPTLVATLLLCWSLLPEPAFWSAAALAVFFLPAFLGMFAALGDKPHDMLWRQHLANWWRGARGALGHAVMSMSFLPHEAWYSVDAIARGSWRLVVSKRRLLEWKAASLARSSLDLEANWRNMWFAPALAVGTALLLSFAHPFALFAAAPLLLLWFLSPILAWWLSLPFVPRVPQLSGEQTLFLTRLARRTWGFFETQAGPGHNWLAPDTLQEHPQASTLPRTSPTSIGVGLLASLAARDFGFIAQAELLARVRAAFDSMALLERYRGHFYSGYDTQTLAPLLPKYVSTVESGNLAGYLLTLAAGLEQMADEPVAGVTSLAGARATLDVIGEHAPPADALARCRAALGPDSCRSADTLPGLADCLQAAAGAAAALLAALPDDADPQLRAWCERLDSQCRAAHADLLDLAPWMRAVHEYVLDASLTRIPTLRELAAVVPPRATDASSRSLAALVEEGVATANARMTAIATLASQARGFGAMDFGCLYRRELGLLATGYQVDEERPDSDVHDLLASKARLASFIGIAQGQLPQEHWFALGRQLGIVHGEQVLLSRSGALAAYLAPLLVMPTWRNTLLDRSCHAAVRVQIDHARRHGIPWGMSDSSYHAVDAAMQYAYGAFGVPAMGLRRGRGDDLVVAPYASMLALMVEPEAACANLERLAQLGCLGEYGFHDAIDHTAAHLPHGRRHAVVRAFMARHQGMGLLALSNLLHDKPMQARFAADPQCRAASLLLQERVPKSGAFEADAGEAEAPRSRPLPARTVTRPGAAQPDVQLLSNGRYHVMVTGDGGGYSRWGDLALTRWRADAAGFDGGLTCYLRDLDSGVAWPAAWQPALAEPEAYAVRFLEERVELRRRDHGIELLTEIVVSPEDDVELRRMRIRNVTGRARSIELTSHADVALAPPALDNAHPAFSKLFVQGEILPARDAILCTRRPQGQGEAAPWLLHLMTVHGAGAGAASFETSRVHFVGREHGHLLPAALRQPGPLGGHDGVVLDPAVAIRRVLALAPGEEAAVDLVLGAAGTRASALRLIDRYRNHAHADRPLDLAWAHNQAVLRSLDAGEDEAQLFARLAGSLLYPQRALRADPDRIAANGRGQACLQAYGLTGEHPLLLARIVDPANLAFVRQLLQAHAWWRMKGLRTDLAIWIGSSDDTLHDGVRNLVASRVDAQAVACPGGVYVFSSDGVPQEDQLLMQAAASVVLLDERGSLRDQLRRAAAGKTALPPLLHSDTAQDAWTVRTPQPAPPQLVLENGIGGFSADGREYVIRTGPGRPTPAPWSNVLANPEFGTVVSESGTAHTWRGNAQACRLTPWHNDPVRDTGGEAFYLRDEHSGVYWSATGAPRPSGGDYLTRHGFGYSVFEHTAHGIHSELASFVPLDAPLKYAVLKVRNDSSLPRRLSATGYVEWVLGEQRAASGMHVVTGRDDASGALLARSAYGGDMAGSGDMADSVAFFHVDAAQAAFTCDRMEFIGRGRSLAQPAALARAGLSGAAGAALDPCAALQVAFELQPGEQKELVFMLGAGADAPGLVRRHRGAPAAAAAFEKLRAWWDETLGAVRIATPDPALDMLANGWLLYQTIGCRLWARASQYQSGGAQGFREGLQDAMALIHTRPQLLRAQLLQCAAHQFIEGDVQHWWHPPGRRGARTRCADDHLWLPLATCRYIAASGDMAVLDEALPWLEGRALREGEEAYVGEPAPSGQRGDLYEHCVRAIRHGLRFGAHGLPLMGSGDCNEAMDRIGIEGEGESVWLGFFMAEVLARFAELAERRADFGFATTCRAACQVLGARLEEHGWDGAWYRRAFFDDGTALGTQDGAACRIDAMVQAWSVLSGVAGPERAAGAMAAFEAQLMRRGHRLVQLLDPPFDGASQDPGTIAAYPPGVRENGGQCTQAAVWAAMAYARLGQSERAWELLELLNPIKHAASREDAGRYGLEPYVLADDVCAAAPHIGRGGWSWYTGSAGWMYRLIVESLLGVERRGERLVLAPQLPCGWPGFRMEYRYRSAVYEIEVRFAEAGALLVDGRAREGNTLDLADDGQRHRVELLVPRRHGPAMAAAHEPTQSKSIT
ncbi:glucoamylase family protein [Massilia sp. YIM B02769]|uniref:GH36-type glycosyl hydrolase domain-containing protein n=1 Tax=Massilia sp. YIM B02769 TaxID=3050129 RepID=UPI0025B6B340|nr:glucoamylase family protein [Massilia sp. YIM B02769]MDN4061555.1 glucoamylase family protein [Massilia sp. YIM B02769]